MEKQIFTAWFDGEVTLRATLRNYSGAKGNGLALVSEYLVNGEPIAEMTTNLILLEKGGFRLIHAPGGLTEERYGKPIMWWCGEDFDDELWLPEGVGYPEIKQFFAEAAKDMEGRQERGESRVEPAFWLMGKLKIPNPHD